jgi:hypothetical protein
MTGGLWQCLGAENLGEVVEYILEVFWRFRALLLFSKDIVSVTLWFGAIELSVGSRWSGPWDVPEPTAVAVATETRRVHPGSWGGEASGSSSFVL